MSKIVCDSKNLVRFYFTDAAPLTVTDQLIIAPSFDIGDPRVYTMHEGVALPVDIATYRYYFDGVTWTKGEEIE